MSDSGLPQLPPGGRYPDLSSVPLKSEQSVRVEFMRGELRHNPEATRVQGEVTKIDRDGNATIRTADGDEIDVKIRGRATLQEGQKVEIDLPPRDLPRQAMIRPVPLPDAPLPQQIPSLPAQGQEHSPAATPIAVATPPLSSSSPHPAPSPVTQAAPSTIPPEIRAILNDVKAPILPLSQPLSQSLPDARPELPPGPVALNPKSILPLLPLSAFPPANAMLPEAPLQRATPLPLSVKISGATIPAGKTDQPVAHSVRGFLASPVAPLPIAGFYMLPDTMPVTVSPMKILFTLTPAKPLQPPSPLTITHSPFAAEHIVADPTAPPVLTTLPKAALFATGPVKIFEPSVPPLMFAPQTASDAPPLKLHVRIASVIPAIDLHPVVSPSEGQSIPPADKPDPPADQSSAVSLQARVVGITRQQYFPVLSVMQPSAPEGLPYLLQSSTLMLPVDSTVELLPQSAPVAGAAMPLAPLLHALPPVNMDFFSGWTWPVFDDALDILSATPEAAQNAAATSSLAKILPSPSNPAQMGSAILFFVAAIRSGDVGGWMGEKALNILKRDSGRSGDILEKLTREISGLSRLLSEPLSQDWRGMPIPYLWQNEVQKMHLYYRHQGSEDQDQPEEKKDRSTRFIFDLHLDRMGDVQLDGLMKAQRLDLILRTHTPFARGMQQVMRQKYLDILDAGKLEGDLAFQTRKDQWVKVDARQASLKTTA